MYGVGIEEFAAHFARADGSSAVASEVAQPADEAEEPDDAAAALAVLLLLTLGRG